jgi:hypothetical protein
MMKITRNLMEGKITTIWNVAITKIHSDKLKRKERKNAKNKWVQVWLEISALFERASDSGDNGARGACIVHEWQAAAQRACQRGVCPRPGLLTVGCQAPLIDGCLPRLLPAQSTPAKSDLKAIIPTYWWLDGISAHNAMIYTPSPRLAFSMHRGQKGKINSTCREESAFDLLASRGTCDACMCCCCFSSETNRV